MPRSSLFELTLTYKKHLKYQKFWELPVGTVIRYTVRYSPDLHDSEFRILKHEKGLLICLFQQRDFLFVLFNNVTLQPCTFFAVLMQVNVEYIYSFLEPYRATGGN